MKLTSLEIERTRRSTERKATIERVAMVDRRLAAIEKEQNEIRELLLICEANEADQDDLPPVKTPSTQKTRMQLKY